MGSGTARGFRALSKLPVIADGRRRQLHPRIGLCHSKRRPIVRARCRQTVGWLFDNRRRLSTCNTRRNLRNPVEVNAISWALGLCLVRLGPIVSGLIVEQAAIALPSVRKR
jgi:hypothetical protein